MYKRQVVEVPNENAQNSTQWAIASDGMWLMPIPDRDSEAGRRTNSKVYEDAESVLHITDVPYGTKPAVGSYCTDANVNNALAIVAGMTTELADRVTSEMCIRDRRQGRFAHARPARCAAPSNAFFIPEVTSCA